MSAVEPEGEVRKGGGAPLRVSPPRITILTPWLDRAPSIAATVESVAEQAHPDLEHIVIDGGSTDALGGLLARHPQLRRIYDTGGMASALNHGLQAATGEICAILNAGDTLVPGALARVAAEIDPARGRHVVMGRSRFIDEDGRFSGVEHPSRFESHRRVLEVWKGYTIPEPAVFWAREAWPASGPLDDAVTPASIGYQLSCDLSRAYRFTVVDEVLAAQRFDPEFTLQRANRPERLDERVRISRRYWGSRWRPAYWRLALSLARYRFDRTGRARRWLRQARERRGRRRALAAVAPSVGASVIAPDVCVAVVVYPLLKDAAKWLIRTAVQLWTQSRRDPPESAQYLAHSDVWNDGWAGPRLIVTRTRSGDGRVVRVLGWTDLTYMTKPFVLTAWVDGGQVGQRRIDRSGNFALEFAVWIPADDARREHTVEVQASAWFVPPHRLFGERDVRALSWRVGDVRLE